MEMNHCEMAYLDFLENPESGQEEKSFLIELDVVPTIPMYCRGGQSCCHKDHLYRYQLGYILKIIFYIPFTCDLGKVLL